MPTPTYDLIEEQTLTTSIATVTFSSIPGTYKDLVIEGLMLATADSADGLIRFNSDTGSNYSATFLYGYTGSGNAVSGRVSSQTSINGIFPRTTAGTCQLQIMSYANTNVNKTVLQRVGVANYAVWAGVGLWRSTAAITSVSLSPSGANWASGTVLRLWGIAG